MTGLTHNQQIRNVAIIAHVDHGKTTLVDAMFRQCGTFRPGQVMDERLMDRMDLERERGITITAKNCAVIWRGVKINIIDTPGHADFGGEVERALSMVDGALLLVDAAEGPLPQTRFVLRKALELGLRILVVINKIDRPDARPAAVTDQVMDLLIDLDAHEDQLDVPVLYASGRDGIVRTTIDGPDESLEVLLDAVLKEISPPTHREGEPFQMLVSDLSYADHLGRLAIGKVYNGSVASKDQLQRIDSDGELRQLRVTRIQLYDGIVLASADAAQAGDIAVLSGIDDIHIGDTICTTRDAKALPRIAVDAPTVSIRFARNTSPLAGREGTIFQPTKIKDRLIRETLQNVSISMDEAADRESFVVKGRGEFQLAILIETMRREGFELCVGRPQVIFRDQDGKRLEPVEELSVDCNESFMGVVTEKLSRRKGRMLSMSNHDSGRVRMEFRIPSRGLIGYRDEFLTDTRGTGIMNSILAGYEPYQGDFVARPSGSLISMIAGSAIPYALFNLEPRGRLFVRPGDPVYEGMIIGEHNRDKDLDVNPCKTKKLTNVRAAAKDEAVTLTPITPLTLEVALQFIRDDEMVEVTPQSLRLRKVVLTAQDRKTASRR